MIDDSACGGSGVIGGAESLCLRSSVGHHGRANGEAGATKTDCQWPCWRCSSVCFRSDAAGRR